MPWARKAPFTQNVVQTLKTDTFSTASTGFTDVTGLSVVITPTSATSKVLVSVTIYASASAGILVKFNLLRGATNLAQPPADTHSASMSTQIQSTIYSETMALLYLDSPATTSATTYKIQMAVNASTGYVNRRGDGASISAVSSITAQEIKQ